MNNEVTDTQPIDFKRVVIILLRYKFLIVFITILFGGIAGYVAYFKPSVYLATSNLSIKMSDSVGGDDILSAALGGGVKDKDFMKEEEAIQSKYMALKALENIELGKRYFTKKSYKYIELYKSSPFIVDIEFMDASLYGKKVYLYPIDSTSFKLEVKEKSSKISKIINFITMSDDNIIFSDIFNYNEDLTTQWCKIKVQKVQELVNKEYSFSYTPNKYMSYMIRKGLSVSTSAGGSMKLHYEDTVPKRAQEVLIAIANAYKSDEYDRDKAAADRTLKFIDEQLHDLSVVLDRSANKLKSFKQAESVVNLDNSAVEASTKLKDIKNQIKRLELEEGILANLLDYIKNKENLNAISISSDALSNTSIYENIQKYHELEKARRNLLISVTEFHPDIISANEELRLLRESITYMIISTSKNIQRKITVLKESRKEYKNALYSIPRKAGTLATLNRSYSINENIYTFLLQKRVETAIVNSSKTSNVRIMEVAEIPMVPFKPNRKFIVLTGLIVGFILGSVIAFILYFRDYTIKDIEEVESVVNLPFYGLIPKLIKGKYTIAYEEAFRTLRTNLEFVKVNKNSKVILVASAISGEGKSTSIKNLSEMLVKLNKKTIVLDFDLRRPSIHKYFKGLSNDIGVSTLLSGQSNLQESIQKTEDGIYVLCAGSKPPNPSELIMSDAAKLLFKTLSSTYDYILIDSPPYSIVTDANILMKEADITLFSIMVEHTKRDTVKKLNALVERYEVKSAGIIYNGVKLSKIDKTGYGYFD